MLSVVFFGQKENSILKIFEMKKKIILDSKFQYIQLN